MKQYMIKMGHVLCSCEAHENTDENINIVNASFGFMFVGTCAINPKQEEGDSNKLWL